jgi:archaemetzincin
MARASLPKFISQTSEENALNYSFVTRSNQTLSNCNGKENMGEYHFHFHGYRSLRLTLLPCGPVEREDLNHLASALSEKGRYVRIATEQPVPLNAFNSRRQQYRADDFLKIARNESGDRVLVVTNCDLYADNLNFVFGLAESFGKCAVISLFRLRFGITEEEFRRRVVKEAVHEIGHTFGLAHCAKPSCVMFFSNSLVDTDRKETNWCEGCEKKLQRNRGHAPLFQ